MTDVIERYHAHLDLYEGVMTGGLVVLVLAVVVVVALALGGDRLPRLSPEVVDKTMSTSVVIAGVLAVSLFAGTFAHESRSDELLADVGRETVDAAPAGAVLPDLDELGRCVVSRDLAAVPANPTPCEARLLDGDSVSTWVLVVGNDRVAWVRNI